MTVLFQQDYMSWFMENITLFTHIYHISKWEDDILVHITASW